MLFLFIILLWDINRISFHRIRTKLLLTVLYIFFEKLHKTRMHSSRMHTSCLLPISPSMHHSQGGTCPGGTCPGGVPVGGTCKGGYLPEGSVPALGYLPWGTCPGGTCQGGVPTWVGCTCPRGCTCPGTPPMNRMTDRCKNITLPQTSFVGSKYRNELAELRHLVLNLL